MSLTKVPCVILTCDGQDADGPCGDEFGEDYAYHYPDTEDGRKDARLRALDSYWAHVDGKDYCPNHSPLRGECAVCGTPIVKAVEGAWKHDPEYYYSGEAPEHLDKAHTPYDVDEEPVLPLGPRVSQQENLDV